MIQTITRSHTPPTYPAIAPTSPAMSAVTGPTMRPMSRDFCRPAIDWAKMSCPIVSVPNQWSRLGPLLNAR